jgi:NAD-dependent deacetylase
VIERALAVAETTDLLLAVGSTLQVYPVANMVPRAKTAGARVGSVNADPTKFDGLADGVLQGSIGALLPTLCGTAGD